MKAMILAAGFGTRLGSVTKSTPKCLLPVGGKAMLEHVVDRLKAAGVDSVVINLHHLSSLVEAFVKERNSFGIEVQFSREETILGTGGGVKQAESFLGNEDFFLIHNADVYCDIELADLMAHHRKSCALATLAVVPCSTEKCLLSDREGRLTGWISKEAGVNYVLAGVEEQNHVTFCGVHAVAGGVFEFVREESGAFSILTPYMKAVQAGCRLVTYQISDQAWTDVGTVEEWQRLDKRLSAAASR